MTQGIERFFKTAIVDKNLSISSAALVSAYHLLPAVKDVVRRWSSEIQEAIHAKITGLSGTSFGSSSYLSFGSSPHSSASQHILPSSSFMTQYHALGLIYQIRQQDKMAIAKIVQQLVDSKSGIGGLKNPLALCMLIRFAGKLAEDDAK